MIYQEAVEILLIIQWSHSEVFFFFFLFGALELNHWGLENVLGMKNSCMYHAGEFCNPCSSLHVIFRDVENSNALPVESVCLATPYMGSSQENSYKSATKKHVQMRQLYFFVKELPLCIAINTYCPVLPTEMCMWNSSDDLKALT